LIRGITENSNWDIKQLENENYQFDLDYDPGKQLEIVPDWGSIVKWFIIKVTSKVNSKLNFESEYSSLNFSSDHKKSYIALQFTCEINRMDLKKNHI